MPQHPAWHSEGTNIDGYGEIYDKMRIVEPKAEDDILRCFMHTRTHAARNHRERVGAIIARLFELSYVISEGMLSATNGQISDTPKLKGDISNFVKINMK